MSEENEPEVKLTKTEAKNLSNLLKKLDALEKKVDALIPEESEEKEDADPRDVLISKYAVVLKSILKGSLPDEKLDAMTPEELLIAHDLRSNISIKREIGNEIKTDSKPDVSYAEKMRGVIFK